MKTGPALPGLRRGQHSGPATSPAAGGRRPRSAIAAVGTTAVNIATEQLSASRPRCFSSPALTPTALAASRSCTRAMMRAGCSRAVLAHTALAHHSHVLLPHTLRTGIHPRLARHLLTHGEEHFGSGRLAPHRGASGCSPTTPFPDGRVGVSRMLRGRGQHNGAHPPSS